MDRNLYYEQLEKECDPNPNVQYEYHLTKALEALEKIYNQVPYTVITQAGTENGVYYITISGLPKKGDK